MSGWHWSTKKQRKRKLEKGVGETGEEIGVRIADGPSHARADEGAMVTEVFYFFQLMFLPSFLFPFVFGFFFFLVCDIIQFFGWRMRSHGKSMRAICCVCVCPLLLQLLSFRFPRICYIVDRR